MKFLRFLLIGLAVVAVLLVVVVALAFTPGVQTWAARKFAPASPELTVEIGRVNAGLNETRVENVRVIQPGMVLTLPSAEIEVGVLDAAGGKVQVKRLVAKGWTLDLTAPGAKAEPTTQPEPAPEPTEGKPAAKRKPFDGVFKQLELPVDLLVDGVDVAGDVILPAGRAQVAINGGGLAAGQDGKFTLKADFKGGPTSASLNGVATARLATPRTFERFELTATGAATAPQVPKGVKIDTVASAAVESGGEVYLAAVRMGGRELFRLDAKLPAGSAPLSGAWKLDVTTADAASVAQGQALPEVVAKGQGSFEAERTFERIATSGALDATLDKLAAIQPEFAALGRLVIAAKFDAGVEGDLARLKTLEARVNGGSKPVASVVALQPIAFNTATGEVAAEDKTKDLLRVALDGVPLAWAKPFLGDMMLTGEDVRGAFTAAARNGGFALRPAEPITLKNVSVSQAGKPLVSALDVTLAAQADYTPQGWTAEVADLSVQSGRAALFKLTAKAVQPAGEAQPMTASGKFEADLPAVALQPAIAESLAVTGGVVRGEFSASVAKGQQVEAKVQLAELAGADGKSMPTVALEARATVDEVGRITAKAPLILMHQGRRSDVTLDAVVTPGEKQTDIRAQLTGEKLFVQDAMLLSGLSPQPPANAPGSPVPAPRPGPVPAPTPAPGPKPTVPLWDGVTGELKLAFKTLVYTNDLQVKNFEGAVRITPTALTLESLGAAVSTGGTMKATGGLRFDAKAAQAYELKADVSAKGVDAAPILRALSPGEPAPVEGKFDIETELAGRAADPAGFSDSAIGEVRVTSQGGVFKVLNVKTSAMVEGADTVSSFAGAAAELFGALGGKSKDVERVTREANRAKAVTSLAKQLRSIAFDKLTLVMGRDEKNNFGIRDLTLMSPTVMFKGAGGITYVPGVALWKQPLVVNLQLGAKDRLEADLRTLGLIDKRSEKVGEFLTMNEPLQLGGTLQSISAEQVTDLFRRLLMN